MAHPPLNPMEEKLLDYIEGELPDAQRQELEAALERDPQLAETVRRMQADRRSLRAMPRAEAPEDLVETLMQQRERAMLLGEPDQPLKLTDDRAGRRTMRLSRLAAYGAMAAAVALCGSLIVLSLTDMTLLQRATEWAGGPATEPEPSVAMESMERSRLQRQSERPEVMAAAPGDAAGAEAAADAGGGAETVGDADPLGSMLAAAEAERVDADMAAPEADREQEALASRASSPSATALGAPDAVEPLAANRALALSDTTGGEGAGEGTGGVQSGRLALAPRAPAVDDQALDFYGGAMATEPEVETTVEVVTEDPGSAARSVVYWARSNNFRVVEAPPVDLRTMTRRAESRQAASTRERGFAEMAREAQSVPSAAGKPEDQQVVLLVDSLQVDDLVAKLNVGNQVARLQSAMHPPAPAALPAEPVTAPLPTWNMLVRPTEERPMVGPMQGPLQESQWLEQAQAKAEAVGRATEPSAFSYGQVLETQLPLLAPTPLPTGSGERPVKVRVRIQQAPMTEAGPTRPPDAEAPLAD